MSDQKITPFMCNDCAVRHAQVGKIIDLGLVVNDLRDELREVTAQRDRARDIAVSLEQELADLGGRS